MAQETKTLAGKIRYVRDFMIPEMRDDAHSVACAVAETFYSQNQNGPGSWETGEAVKLYGVRDVDKCLKSLAQKSRTKTGEIPVPYYCKD